MPRTLHDLTPSQLVEHVVERGLPAYRGRQLAHALFARGIDSLEAMTELPRDLRARLEEENGLVALGTVEREEGEGGTAKYLFALADATRIEAVAIAMGEERRTFCVSSQVGCRMACVFCATARMGLVRQLSAGEMVAQVLTLRRMHPTQRQCNVVFMGMGEPLDNFEELAQALAILSDPQGVGIGARHITISTSGVLDGIVRLGEIGKPFGLAVSVTTASAQERRRLMPVAGDTPLEQILEAAADYGRRVRRKVTLECALIAGVNDRIEDAHRLVALARRGPFKANLIPLNPIEGFDGQRPEREAIDRFADVLWQAGIVATVRDSAGREVAAACGQLVQKRKRPS